jgi:hypothetical protein
MQPISNGGIMSDVTVDMRAILQESHAIRADADTLLHAFGIPEHLALYGSVRIVGSYQWDLMLNGDIDLEVLNPDITLDQALAALSHFIRQGSFYGVTFYDSVRHQLPWEAPTGYYIELTRSFNGRLWTVEVWFKLAAEPAADWITERLTEENRRIILLFKHLRNMRGLAIPSYEIYKAVLVDQLTDPAIFLNRAAP